MAGGLGHLTQFGFCGANFGGFPGGAVSSFGGWDKGGGVGSADVLDRPGEVGGGEEEVDAVGHEDEGEEFVEAFVAVVLEGFDVGVGVGGGLRKTGWSLRLRLHSGLRRRGRLDGSGESRLVRR